MNLYGKDRIKKILKYLIIFMVIAAILTALFLLIGARYDLMGWTNSLTFTTILLLALMWLTFASNKGAFDIITFGLKSFFNAFKKDYEKLNYYEYTQNKEKISSEYYIALTIAFVIYLIPTIVLFVLVLV